MYIVHVRAYYIGDDKEMKIDCLSKFGIFVGSIRADRNEK